MTEIIHALRSLQNTIGHLEAERDHYRSLHQLHSASLDDQRRRQEHFLEEERAVQRSTLSALTQELAKLSAEVDVLRGETAQKNPGLASRLYKDQREDDENLQKKFVGLVKEKEATQKRLMSCCEEIASLEHELKLEREGIEAARAQELALQNTFEECIELFTAPRDSDRRHPHTPSQGWSQTPQKRKTRPPFVPNGSSVVSFNASTYRPRAHTVCVGKAVVPGLDALGQLRSSLKQEISHLRRSYDDCVQDIALSGDVAALEALTDEIERKCAQLRSVEDEIRYMRCSAPVTPSFVTNRCVEQRVQQLHNVLSALQHSKM
eukprot:PhM_4_TR3343/c0_g1_i1/m.31291